MATLTPPGAASPAPSFCKGFSLIELAVVLFIVSLLIGGMLMPLSAQQDMRAYRETEKLLANARDAVLGFAVLNERLPCPASANSAGREAFCSTANYPCSGVEQYTYDSATNNGVCFDYYGGLLPSVSLGVQPTDSLGFAVDEWGQTAANRLRYAVSTNALRAFGATLPTPLVLTRSQGIKAASLKPDLSVCSSAANVLYAGTRATGQNNYAQCVAGTALIEDAMVIIYSLGKNAGSAGNGLEETHNPNPLATVASDPAFVLTNPGPGYDDQMLWISAPTLINRLVAAGRM